jgi:hypothetical protein
MPSDDMYGGLPYRDARGTVVFDNTSKLVPGFLSDVSVMVGHSVKWSRYCIFRNRSVAQGYVAYNYRDKMEASAWASTTNKDVSTLTSEEEEEISNRVQE